MRSIFIAIALFALPIASKCQEDAAYIRVYIEKPELLYKNCVIVFSDSCTDGFDWCCDAIQFGGSLNSITTEIGITAYVFNCFPKITEDRIIPLNININPDTGLFIIGTDLTVGDMPSFVLLDAFVPGYHQMPYICQGPVSNERFSLLFEYPLSVDVNTGCGTGFVIIDNDEQSIDYELEFEGVVTQYPASTDTIFNLQNGDYTLSVYDSIVEQINFTVDAITIEAELTVPNTYLYIIDPYIVPVLNVYSPYTNVIWDFGDGTIFTGDLNPVHAYLQEGIYTLRVTIYSGECYRTIESIITIVPVPTGINEVSPTINKIKRSKWDLLGRQLR
jgi:hypothetical protein